MSTQWAAQFLVAAELERQGYIVTFTMGHATPVADLMIGNSEGDQFWVDVKGLASNNAWWGKKKSPRRNLFYVLVRVGETRNKDRFFVLSQVEFNNLIEAYEIAHPKAKKLGGFDWKAPHQFEGKWEKLPGWQ
jgi:hypothetical protein